MTKELFELLERIASYLGSIAVDFGYFADKARAEDAQEAARNAPPAPAPEKPAPAPQEDAGDL